MKVVFVLALAFAQGLAAGIQISNLPANAELHNDVEISNLPGQVEINHLPADLPNNVEISHLPGSIDLPDHVEISHLPGSIDVPDHVEISHLPGSIDVPDHVEISHLPGLIDVPDHVEISHLPGLIDVPDHIEIGHLPGQISPEAEATPSCVKYVRALLEEVLATLPGAPVDRPSVPALEQTPSVESACARCFQKLQLLIEKANSRNSIVTF